MTKQYDMEVHIRSVTDERASELRTELEVEAKRLGVEATGSGGDGDTFWYTEDVEAFRKFLHFVEYHPAKMWPTYVVNDTEDPEFAERG